MPVLIVSQCCCDWLWLGQYRPRRPLCTKQLWTGKRRETWLMVDCWKYLRVGISQWMSYAECEKPSGFFAWSQFFVTCVYLLGYPQVLVQPSIPFILSRNQLFSVQTFAHLLQALAVVNTPCLWKHPGLLGCLSRSREVTVMRLLSCPQPSASHSSLGTSLIIKM